MNKIYLLILSLFVGITTYADDHDFYLNYVFDNYEGPRSYEHFNHSGKDTDSQKEYHIDITARGSILYFGIKVPNVNAYLKTSWEIQDPGVTIEMKREDQKDFYKDATFYVENGKKYRVTLYFKSTNISYDACANTHYVKFELAPEQNDDNNDSGVHDNGTGKGGSTNNFYFYGDMNRWSSYTRNAGENVVVVGKDENGKEIDIAETVFNGVVQKHFTQAELDKMYRFTKIENTTDHEKYRKFLGNDWNGWYFLDFKNSYDGEGNKGRLCGQFKITKGDHLDEKNNWDFEDGGYNAEYFRSTIQVGSDKTWKAKNTKLGQNLQLEANYVDNAVLYFKPDDGSIKIDGTPVYNYVYYAIADGTMPDASKLEWEMVAKDQNNYFINSDGFNYNGTSKYDENLAKIGGNVEAQTNKGVYQWEPVSSAKCNLNGKTYTNVLRRRIPSGATHRYPVEVTISTFKDEDTDYPEAQVLCNDIWFVRAVNNTNVYFRYDDEEATRSLDWVCYNVFNNNMNENGVVTGYNYLFGGTKDRNDSKQPSITNGEYAVMQVVENHTAPDEKVAHTWWKSAKPLPNDFATNSWVIFGESRGGVYPIDRVKSNTASLSDFRLVGEDLYYVATTKENPSLLYSHLNGTFSLDKSINKIVQVNAEMYDPSTMNDNRPALLTNTAEVTYRYEIYNNGSLIACNDEEGTCHTGQQEALLSSYANKFSDKPFFNWDVADLEPGYYFVVVKAIYNGKVYTAQDTYAIYE